MELGKLFRRGWRTGRRKRLFDAGRVEILSACLCVLPFLVPFVVVGAAPRVVF